MTRRPMMGALAAFAAALALPAAAQAWPTKPVRILVPCPPGGSSDIIARAIGQPLSEAPGQTVVAENRAGANGNTGSDAVAKSGDGRTLLPCDVGALASSPSVRAQLPFDPSKDLRGAGRREGRLSALHDNRQPLERPR